MKIFDGLQNSEQELLLELENRDKKERDENVDTKYRLRQIPRETGEFLYGLLSNSSINKQNWKGLEIGSSGGYSTMWQGFALRDHNSGKLISLEIDPKKVELATSNLNKANLEKHVNIIRVDAQDYISSSKEQFDYIFVDAEKSDYTKYLKLLKGNVYSGSICVADNIISHADDLKEFINYLDQESSLKYTILSIGKGLAFIEFL